MPDRYQELRDAIAAGVLIYPADAAALLADNDKLREALADIGRVAHLIRNTLVSNQVVIDDDGAREHAYALCLEWEEADAKARAALADGEASNGS